MDNKGRGNKSLCEKSMKMMVNVVKLSSFSIAKMSLGTVGPPPATKNLASLSSGFVKVANGPPLPKFPGSQRAQQPKSSSEPTYLIEPIEENVSSYTTPEETGIDGKASDYIRRVHEKNRHDSREPTL